MTLKELLDANPDWADLPIVVLRADGSLAYVGSGSATVFLFTDDQANTDVVAFSED
jgi:hypothetical protein